MNENISKLKFLIVIAYIDLIKLSRDLYYFHNTELVLLHPT